MKRKFGGGGGGGGDRGIITSLQKIQKTYRIACARPILGCQVATLRPCQSAVRWPLLVRVLTLMTLIFIVNGFCSLVLWPLICLAGLSRRGVCGVLEPFCLPWLLRRGKVMCTMVYLDRPG